MSAYTCLLILMSLCNHPATDLYRFCSEHFLIYSTAKETSPYSNFAYLRVSFILNILGHLVVLLELVWSQYWGQFDFRFCVWYQRQLVKMQLQKYWWGTVVVRFSWKWHYMGIVRCYRIKRATKHAPTHSRFNRSSMPRLLMEQSAKVFGRLHAG